MKGFLRDECGIEPFAVKLLAGLLLAAVAIGIGYALYTVLGGWIMGVIGPRPEVTVSPMGATIDIPAVGEENKTFTVDVISMYGVYDKLVKLRYSPPLTGVTITFSPENGTPPFGSTMTISVSSTAVPGTTTITIYATGEDGKEDYATLELKVT